MNALVPSPPPPPNQRVLHGEIFPPGVAGAINKELAVRVFIAVGPLRSERRLVYCLPGWTVRECIDFARSHTDETYPTDSYRVYIEGRVDVDVVPLEWWDRVRPKPGTTLFIRPVPQAFIVPLFAAIAGAISITAIITQLIVGIILMGISYLVGKLFAPKPTPEQKKGIVSYSISGSRNQALRYEPIPLILGSHRISPPYAAAPYTERVGNDQYLRMEFVVGYGPLNIPLAEIRIGETPVTQFEEVQIEIREGQVGDPPTTLYPNHVVEESLAIELTKAAGWQQRTTADDVTVIQVELVWPQGLFWVNDKGEYQNMGSHLQWGYRLVGTSTFTNIAYSRISRSADTQRHTLSANVPLGKYDVQVAKVGKDQNSTKVSEDVQWIALRGFRTGAPVVFPLPLGLIALRIKGTGQLNSIIDTLNCMAESRVLAWNGAAWVANTVSRNPADLFRHVLQCKANKKPVADIQIDLLAVQTWWAYCNAQGFTYDKPVTAVSSIQDLIGEICVAGRASQVFKDGKWSVVWDEQVLPVVQMFTPRNSKNFEGTINYATPPHAFRIPFVNRDKKFAEDERIVYDDGYNKTNATDIQVIEFSGVTTSNAVWKHGRFHIAQARLRPATYTLDVDFEGLVLVRNDRVYVQHDMLFVGLDSGRVRAVDASGAQGVTVDHPLLMVATDSYQLRFRNDASANSFTTRLVVPGTEGELTVIPLVGTLALPDVGALFTFGRTGADSGVYRVIEVEPQEELVHRLTLVDDALEISDADTGAIPAYTEGISLPVDPFLFPPSSISITDGLYEEDGQFFIYLRISWTIPRKGKVAAFEIEYRNESEGFWYTTTRVSANTNFTTIFKVTSGLYTARVRNIFVDGTWSSWLTSSVYDADAAKYVPEDVTGFSIAVVGEVSTLSWNPVPGPGVKYEIRFAPADAPTPQWNTAIPFISNIVDTTVQTQTAIGTFLIKAQSALGIWCINATFIVTSIASLVGTNVVETIEEPTWTGNRTNVSIIANELRITEQGTIDKWESLSTIINMVEGDGELDAQGYPAEGSYTFPGNNSYIDLGLVYTPVRVTSFITAYGFNDATTMSTWVKLSDVTTLNEDEPEGWEVQMYYQSTEGPPATGPWSEWIPLTVSDITMRAIRFKLVLRGKPAVTPAGVYSVNTPAVISLKVEVDMPDRSYGQSDIPCPTGGLSVLFNPAFAELRGLGVAGQSMANGDYYVINPPPSNTGFTIIFRNAAGTAISKTFDFVAWGFGRIV